MGGTLVVPKGLLDKLGGKDKGAQPGTFARDPEQIKRIEQLAMQDVMDTERRA